MTQKDGLSGPVLESLRAAVRGKGTSQPLTIVFVDSAYGQVMNNWLRHAQPLIGNNLIVFALDEEMDARIRRLGVSSVLLPYRGGLDSLWILRLHVFEAICRLGVSFIHSDADAVWLKDPRDYCWDTGADLAISPGTIWPPDVAATWGFVLCCGFFFARASERMSTVLAAVKLEAAKESDDQIALNRVLLNAGLDWRTDQLPFDVQEVMGHQFRNYHGVVFGRTRSRFDIDVALLPQDLFQRIPRPFGAALVKHPLTPKEQVAKIAVMRELGCWRD